MFRILAVVLLLLPLTVTGCSSTWQANRASQAVDINPLAILSGQPVLSPANGPGYINGEALDMRRR
jgi:hypothetical protein